MCVIIPLRNFDCAFAERMVCMDGEKEKIKGKIIEFIDGIERLDILYYILTFITTKFKAGD